MTTKQKCTSCNTDITNDSGAVEFPCPKCAKQKLRRCTKCRKIAAKYNCAECGYRGPN